MSRRESPKPDWVIESKAITHVDKYMSSHLGDDNSKQFLYFLPPPHLFYAQSTTSTVTVTKVHNWIRVRSWCFEQIGTNEDILMTTNQWRVALEGKYYAKPYGHLKVDLWVSPEEIGRLPPPPPDTKRRRVEEPAPTPKHKKNTETGQHRRAAAKLQIAVRFGLDGGFAPYDPDEKVEWGKESLDAKALSETHLDVIKEIVWEISVASFRLELLDIDRTLLSIVYAHPNPALAAHREAVICRIWNNGWVRPTWEDDVQCDPMSAHHWEDRVEATRKFAFAMSVWPNGEKFCTIDVADTNSEQAFTDFEYLVFLFYADTFHSLKGRRPILPMLRPPSMRSTIPDFACTQ